MTGDAPTYPLRDWGLDSFRRLDRPTLDRLHHAARRLADAAWRNNAERSKDHIAIEVFMAAHSFGTLTLADVLDWPAV